MKGTKQGGYVPPMAKPADTGNPSPLGSGGADKVNVADQSVGSGKQDFGKTFSGRGGSLQTGGKDGGVPRHLKTGTANGKGNAKPSGARYTGQSGGGYVPGTALKK